MKLNKTKLLKNLVYILTLFVRSFGSPQGAGLRSSEVVRVVRRAMDDWPVTPQGSKRTTKMQKSVNNCEKMTKTKAFESTTKPSLFLGKPSFLLPLICKSKPNFKSLELSASTCKRKGYNHFFPKTNKKTKPNPNPIQSQFQASNKYPCPKHTFCYNDRSDDKTKSNSIRRRSR